MEVSMRKALIIAVIALVSSCAAFWSTVKTVADVARCLCQVAATEQLEAAPDALSGMTADEWCEHEENLRPFIDHVTEAKQAASQKVGFSKE